MKECRSFEESRRHIKFWCDTTLNITDMYSIQIITLFKKEKEN